MDRGRAPHRSTWSWNEIAPRNANETITILQDVAEGRFDALGECRTRVPLGSEELAERTDSSRMPNPKRKARENLPGIAGGGFGAQRETGIALPQRT